LPAGRRVKSAAALHRESWKRRRRDQLHGHRRAGGDRPALRRSSQFICQLLGAALCTAWAFGATFIVFNVVDGVKSMRVAPEVELKGLDVPEFGLPAYPEDATVPGEDIR
jgi:ammonia channel protein AmtB